jgi:Uma2 family endonuclease
MTLALPDPPNLGAWTVADLDTLPVAPYQYEIVDGSLIVNPPRSAQHAIVTDRLRRALEESAPPEILVVVEGVGLLVDRATLLVPDVVVVPATALESPFEYFKPADVLLAAQVLAPRTRRYDLVLKRHEYAACGIAQYWIVDPRERAITVLRGPGYRDERVWRPGAVLRTDRPYEIELDPARVV